MQLWEEMLQINGITLRLMLHVNDIRASYATCICWNLIVSGSVAVTHFFALYLWYGKFGCNLLEHMHQVTLGVKLAFSGGHQSSF